MSDVSWFLLAFQFSLWIGPFFFDNPQTCFINGKMCIRRPVGPLWFKWLTIQASSFNRLTTATKWKISSNLGRNTQLNLWEEEFCYYKTFSPMFWLSWVPFQNIFQREWRVSSETECRLFMKSKYYAQSWSQVGFCDPMWFLTQAPVSYTHLTLPTILLV